MKILLPSVIVVATGIAAASADGCSTSISFPGTAVQGTLSGPIATQGCSGQVYVAVPFSDCGFLTACSSGTVYALCDGSQFTECDCTAPGAGWSVDVGVDGGATIDAPVDVSAADAPVDVSATDVSTVDAPTDVATETAADGM
jgi:hypothetical protein